MTKRIGFACKYMHPDQNQPKKLLEDIQRPYNTKATTITWLRNQAVNEAEQRLWDIMVHNIQSFYNLVEYVSTLQPDLRMVRLGSDCLPAYTHPNWAHYWQRLDVITYCERELGKVGDLARANDVRLSFHPGQFTVLASDNETTVDNSIAEFEYHVDMARFMGYGKEFQDFKINVHISGARGPQGIRDALSRMTPEARNTITIENQEFKWGIDASLELEKDCALVLDIHHHWIHSEEYIRPTDDRYKRIVDSWRGKRPVIHYALSREAHLVGHDTAVMPDLAQLLAQGHKKGKLRAHSDYMWNTACNDWALEFNDTADIMVEAKCKNLASIALSEQRG